MYCTSKRTGHTVVHMLYDLHIHSCLSPCSDNDMTPATIAGMAKLAGADIMAVTDHNSALNLPYVEKACSAYGIKLLPGIEVTTAEEIHVLCYFKSVAKALEFGEMLYNKLPDLPCDEDIWGSQLVCDENDSVLEKVPKLLTSATALDVYEIGNICAEYGGIAVPAHVEKDSTSLLSVMGFLPDDLNFDLYESKKPEKLNFYIEKGLFPGGKDIITSSDAHTIEQIAQNLQTLPADSALLRFIQLIV